MDGQKPPAYQAALEYLIKITDFSQTYLSEIMIHSSLSLLENLAQENSSCRFALELMIKKESCVAIYNFLSLGEYQEGFSPDEVIAYIEKKKIEMMDESCRETKKIRIKTESGSDRDARRMLKNLV